MDNLKISIIVPVYNVEKYLDRCIQSVVNQVYKNWELFLINDGSSDDSGQICDKWSNIDNRINVIHKKNGGVSSARNLGLSNASGKWVVFIDSDDEIEDFYLNNLIEDNDGADLVISGYKRIKGDDIVGILKFNSDKVNINEVSRNKSDIDMILLYGCPHEKLFDLEIIRSNKLSFNESLSLNEDQLFYWEYLTKAKSIMTTSHSDYLYRINEGEETLSSKRHPYKERLLAFELLSSKLNEIVKIWNVDKSTIPLSTTHCYKALTSAVVESLRQNASKNEIEDILSKTNRRDLLLHYKPESLKGKILKLILLLPKSITMFLLENLRYRI